jgi:predicted nucleic acid-binding protein
MLLLDTNLVSELMRSRPDPRVLSWVAAQPLAEMGIAAITMMEIRFGIALLPHGSRRAELDARFRLLLTQAFAGRVLAFDQPAADACAEIRAQRRQRGNPVTVQDSMIAAIARIHGAPVVTRDVAGFKGCGLTLINPWQD